MLLLEGPGSVLWMTLALVVVAASQSSCGGKRDDIAIANEPNSPTSSIAGGGTGISMPVRPAHISTFWFGDPLMVEVSDTPKMHD